ncbi:CFEM domain-containing protein [Mycena indigotica]|uniref:CFEM domain-containing protein n=1 Tax=Mycena indigotica TaxID=2126181 RepID=A0A8H6W5M0_9AGAR|nr:CFEM domain-containing protein [Mycena indigotica]KAF7303691.1 CFEM domain-containing protein [Mycena indigotica]
MRFTVALLAFAATAFAQSSSGPASSLPVSGAPSGTGSAPLPSGSADISALTPCIIGCLTAAGQATVCNTFTNVTCVCTNADFQQKSASCFQGECKAAELAPAMALQQSQCAAAGLSATARPTASAPFLPSNPAADISRSGSPSGSAASRAPSSSGSAPPSAAAPLALPGMGLVSAVSIVAVLIGAAAVF